METGISLNDMIYNFLFYRVVIYLCVNLDTVELLYYESSNILQNKVETVIGKNFIWNYCYIAVVERIQVTNVPEVKR